MNYVVTEGNRYCSDESLVRAERTKIFSAADLAIKSIEQNLQVKYIPGSGPLGVDSETEDCRLGSNYRDLQFRSDQYNTGIVLTAVPFKGEKPWVDQLLWVLPCAYDTDGRPVLFRLNFNPAVVGLYTRDEMIPIIQHQLLHGMGFMQPTDALKEYKMIKDLPDGKTDLVYWDPKKYGGEGVTEEIFKCPAKDQAFVLDEEFMLRNASVWDNEYASRHFESKFVWDDIMSNNPTGKNVNLTLQHLGSFSYYQLRTPDTLTVSVNLGDAYYKAIDSNNGGIVSTPTLVRAESELQSTGCNIMVGAKCNTTEGGRYSHFCFPPSPKPDNEDSWMACSNDRKSKTKCDLYNHDHVITNHFRYFDAHSSLGGMIEADYCPRPKSPPVVELCNPTSLPSESHMLNFGERFGSTSRCLESTALKSGFVPSSEKLLRCLQVQCPFNNKIEFRFYGETTWHKCPTDGSAATIKLTPSNGAFVGEVQCPAAADVCDESLVPPPPEPTWTRIPGYRVEFGVVPGTLAPFAKAKEICALYTNGSTLGFLPDANFSAAVKEKVLKAFPSSPSFWTGAATSSPASWITMQGYGHSEFTIPDSPNASSN